MPSSNTTEELILLIRETNRGMQATSVLISNFSDQNKQLAVAVGMIQTEFNALKDNVDRHCKLIEGETSELQQLSRVCVVNDFKLQGLEKTMHDLGNRITKLEQETVDELKALVNEQKSNKLMWQLSIFSGICGFVTAIIALLLTWIHK